MEVMLDTNHEEVHFLDQQHADLIEMLFQTGVVRYGHYKLPDGTHAGVGFSRRRLCRVKWARETVAQGVAQVASAKGDYQVVAGTGSSGLVFAKAVASAMGLPAVGIPRPYWPFQYKAGNGLSMRALEPFEGKRVLLVETVTVGYQGLLALKHACGRAGAYIVAAIVLMARVEIPPGLLRTETQPDSPKLNVIFDGGLASLVWLEGNCQMCNVGTAPLRLVD